MARARLQGEKKPACHEENMQSYQYKPILKVLMLWNNAFVHWFNKLQLRINSEIPNEKETETIHLSLKEVVETSLVYEYTSYNLCPANEAFLCNKDEDADVECLGCSTEDMSSEISQIFTFKDEEESSSLLIINPLQIHEVLSTSGKTSSEATMLNSSAALVQQAAGPVGERDLSGPLVDLDTEKPSVKWCLFEGENLWIVSRLVWFDLPRPPDSSQTAPVKIGPSS
ncbi:hypothetical protein STEG23_016549 [Scotinomys teguina]